MTLGIVTDCTHYKDENGMVCTENHILLRQLQQLSVNFDKTIIACPFGKFDSSKVVTVYNNQNIHFEPLPLVGGESFSDKIVLLKTFPKWLNAFQFLNKHSDVVYQRFPNNLNIPGFIFFWLKRKKVFATYTGTWRGYKGEPFTYKLQRWILNNPFRGPVWVYDEKQNASKKIKAGFSPSYNLADWEEEELQVKQRIKNIENGSLSVYRFITVGTLINYKNQLAIVEACKVLKLKGVPFTLTIVGDGPMRNEIENYILNEGLQKQVFLAGKKNHLELRQLYRENDFIIQAPLKEGFGKVPIEGFFHGVIPIINQISMASAMIGNGERGFLFDANEPGNLETTLLNLPSHASSFSSMIINGRAYARDQTLEAWASDYYTTIGSYYNEI